MRRRFFTALAFFFVLSAGALAQQDADTAAAAARAEEQRREVQQHLLEMERKITDQNEINLRRLEGVERSADVSRQNTDRILLIFALVIILGFFYISGNTRMKQKQMIMQVHNATRGMEDLKRDIRRELSRPELEYLQISHLLRRLMRQLRSPSDSAASSDYLAEVRKAANSPHMPTVLHFIARTLVAENDGNWSIALQMLEQLREMDAKDPDVLLHLSHVHKNIAAKISDRQKRNRHERLAYQYYGMFTSSIEMEALLEEMQDPTVAAPVVVQTEEDKDEPVAPAITEGREDAVPQQQEKPPPPADKAKQSGVKKDAKKPQQNKEKLASVPMTALPAAVNNSQTDTAPTVAEKKDETPPPQDVPKPKKASSDVVVTVASPSTLPAEKTLRAINIKGNIGYFLASLKKGVVAIRDGRRGSLARWVVMLDKLRSLAREKNIEPLPFLPTPAVSKVPMEDDEAAIKMWKEVRNGDQTMVRATSVKSLHERNRLIDRAIIYYAQAQAHKTNKTLYHNWGLALLAKALHVSPKKRAAFYNAAVDKFLAGNVVEPHYFDFYLASLYAIIGNKAECLKWLQTARQSGKLDVESLMQAPDFDSVRNEPWFDEFIQN